MAALTQKKSCSQIMDEWKLFMWNPETKEFMGRTASSWGLILSFYIIFYAFLTAVFALSMYVMLQTIDQYTPKYEDRLGNPGLMIRPNLSVLDIAYNVNASDTTWPTYVSSLNIALQDYNQTVQEERGTNCTPGQYFTQDDTGSPTKQACRFVRDVLGECSGINDPTYGYPNGTPCVFIKMNRVVHFLPQTISSLSNTSVTINCTGKNDQALGPRVYFPSTSANLGSLDLMYFPYYGNRAQKNYTQPFVAVKFLNATRNMLHTVQCSINAANINNNDDRDKFQGRVIFTLRLNS
ncbi:sodium/potassium-transporting ATPase subunit beta-2-like [Hyperolius riggenbachi]|uniref:sodium/potassium-transporting ATPase subunit beta-2-like n=1 Tax=Hyperolius riggenbachi TaxID=752182 RepID=UPI0035A2C2D7